MTIELTLALHEGARRKIMLCWGPACWACPGPDGGTEIVLPNGRPSIRVYESYQEVRKKLAYAFSVECSGWSALDDDAPGVSRLPEPSLDGVH